MSRRSVGSAQSDSDRLKDIRTPRQHKSTAAPTNAPANRKRAGSSSNSSRVKPPPRNSEVAGAEQTSTSHKPKLLPTPPRKGAARIADIPSDVLIALNEGREESLTLVEYLAIDIGQLARHVLSQVGLNNRRKQILAKVDAAAMLSVTQRMRAMGRILRQELTNLADGNRAFEALATHPSDMVRAWAVYSVAADHSLSLEQRLATARRFASDRAMSVRESSWDSFRQHVTTDLDRSITLLRDWVLDDDPNIRRCAVESTRPRGVWTAHIESLKADPSPGLPLLDPLCADPSRYVQTAVGNWLNDASKTRPDWVTQVCDRWWRASRSPNTEWIIHHATRTMRKSSDGS